MTGWDYRVLHRVNGRTGEEWYGIHEVYYDEAGRIWSCTKDAIAPVGYSLEDLGDELETMAKALEQPVLEYGGIPEDGAVSPEVEFNDEPGAVPLSDLLEGLGFDGE